MIRSVPKRFVAFLISSAIKTIAKLDIMASKNCGV